VIDASTATAVCIAVHENRPYTLGQCLISTRMSSTTEAALGPSPTPLAPPEPRDDTGSSIVVSAFVTWGIAVAFVLMRFYTRAFIVRSVKPSDWCIVVAAVCHQCPEHEDPSANHHHSFSLEGFQGQY
jgi:hypothetical protein